MSETHSYMKPKVPLLKISPPPLQDFAKSLLEVMSIYGSSLLYCSDGTSSTEVKASITSVARIPIIYAACSPIPFLSSLHLLPLLHPP